MTASLPETMTAVEIREPGGPEVLVAGERPVPRPGAGEVLIKVAAAGVNRPDCLQRQGSYPPPKGASDIPGLEVAGEVVAVGEGVGEGVTTPKVGDRVCALVTGGGYAEYCLAPAAQCLPVPRGYSLEQAACLPETFFTVWINVFQRSGLKPGETFLVHGGTSGIGTTAIQLAKAFGCTVFTTAGSDEKVKACKALGADHAINYKTEDFVDVVNEHTGGRGVDVVLDMVGGDYIPRNIKAMAEDGRLSFIAFLGGAKAEVNFAAVMMKRLTITGSTLRARPVAVKAQLASELKEKVWPLLDQGKIAPVMAASFPLAEAAKAHALMESSSHIGKIVLTVV